MPGKNQNTLHLFGFSKLHRRKHSSSEEPWYRYQVPLRTGAECQNVPSTMTNCDSIAVKDRGRYCFAKIDQVKQVQNYY